MVHIRLPRLSDSRAWKIDNRAYDYPPTIIVGKSSHVRLSPRDSHEYRSYAMSRLEFFSGRLSLGKNNRVLVVTVEHRRAMITIIIQIIDCFVGIVIITLSPPVRN